MNIILMAVEFPVSSSKYCICDTGHHQHYKLCMMHGFVFETCVVADLLYSHDFHGQVIST